MSQAPFLTRLIHFFKHPTWDKAFTTDWSDIWIAFSWSITGAFITSFFLNTLITLTGAQPEEHSLIQDLFSTQSIQTIFFSVAVLAPVTEEIMFRGWLTPSRKVVTSSLIVSLLYMIIAYNNPIFIVFFVPIFVLAILHYTKRSPIPHNKYVIYSMYYSIFIFGSLHLTNYTDLQNIWFLAPFLILSQIILGVMASYIRIRHNLFFAILLHSFYNTFLFLGFIFLSSNSIIEQADTLQIISVLYMIVYFLGIGTVCYNIFSAIKHTYSKQAQKLKPSSL